MKKYKIIMQEKVQDLFQKYKILKMKFFPLRIGLVNKHINSTKQDSAEMFHTLPFAITQAYLFQDTHRLESDAAFNNVLWLIKEKMMFVFNIRALRFDSRSCVTSLLWKKWKNNEIEWDREIEWDFGLFVLSQNYVLEHFRSVRKQCVFSLTRCIILSVPFFYDYDNHYRNDNSSVVCLGKIEWDVRDKSSEILLICSRFLAPQVKNKKEEI